MLKLTVKVMRMTAKVLRLTVKVLEVERRMMNKFAAEMKYRVAGVRRGVAGR